MLQLLLGVRVFLLEELLFELPNVLVDLLDHLLQAGLILREIVDEDCLISLFILIKQLISVVFASPVDGVLFVVASFGLVLAFEIFIVEVVNLVREIRATVAGDYFLIGVQPLLPHSLLFDIVL